MTERRAATRVSAATQTAELPTGGAAARGVSVLASSPQTAALQTGGPAEVQEGEAEEGRGTPPWLREAAGGALCRVGLISATPPTSDDEMILEETRPHPRHHSRGDSGLAAASSSSSALHEGAAASSSVVPLAEPAAPAKLEVSWWEACTNAFKEPGAEVEKATARLEHEMKQQSRQHAQQIASERRALISLCGQQEARANQLREYGTQLQAKHLQLQLQVGSLLPAPRSPDLDAAIAPSPTPAPTPHLWLGLLRYSAR